MKRNIIAIAIVVTFFGCNSEKRSENADVISVNELNKEIGDTTTSKIIKTADMRFRVKDVQNAKEQLGATLKSQGGSIVEFSIKSEIQESNKVKKSADSLVEITAYRKTGYLIAKIPSEKLDDFTNTISKMAVFVDQAGMKMDDQSLFYLSNKLKAQNRITAVDQVKEIAGKKLSNVQSSLSLNDDYVDRKIDNMSIDARVKYSTITLDFYQDNTIKTMVVANDNIYDYKPQFATRLWLNLVNGWTIFKEILLALANLWLLLVLIITGFFVFRYYKARSI